jgi:hypothetical protein
MRTADRVALIYGASFAGAALLSWLRGKRELNDIAMDALVQGGLVGTGVNVAWWLSADSTYVAAALRNGQSECDPNGRVSPQGVKLLSMINPDTLYRAAKLGRAIMVGPEPEDPHVVQLPNPG